MSQLQLPTQAGGNAGWKWNSDRELLAGSSSVGSIVPPVAPTKPGSDPLPPPTVGDWSDVAFFPTVPETEMWAFERFTLSNFSGPEEFTVRIFFDEDRTDGSQSLTDATHIVEGLYRASPFEVLSRPVPLRVQGGLRLGVAWFFDGGIYRGLARAQVTTYVRA